MLRPQLSALLCMMLLLAPGALCALEFDIRAAKPSAPTDLVQQPKNSSEFAFGNWHAVYPYQQLGPWRPRSKNDWPLLQNLEADVSAVVGFDGGAGLAFESHFTFAFFQLGSLARAWRGADENRDVLAAGTFAGFAGPVWLGQCSVGVGPAFVATEGSTGKAAVLLTTHVTLFPLWPLSLSLDGSFIAAGTDRIGDLGAQLGCMVFRHLFVELGYRVTFLPGHDEVNHGLSIGAAFHWGWGSPRPLFAAPERPGTW